VNRFLIAIVAVSFGVLTGTLYYVAHTGAFAEKPPAQQFGHLSFAASPGANQQVFITATDATGKTRTVTATRVDPFVWDAGNVTIHYTTDQYLCSGFEP
jgi:hypothetical protein